MNEENKNLPETQLSREVEDLTLNETATENVKGGILIGLLLPAVQK
jgi:hypothetical protein